MAGTTPASDAVSQVNTLTGMRSGTYLFCLIEKVGDSDQSRATRFLDRMTNQSTRVDLWVFRDGKKTVATALLIGELAARLLPLENSCTDRSVLLDVLIRAGELESAFADEGSRLVPHIGKLTDALAWHLVHGASLVPRYADLVLPLQQSEIPATVQSSPPEGFSYYGLNPADFIDVARKACRVGDPVAIVGIRSIGITLSAVVAAALSSYERRWDRIGVRPTGHPYDRVASFNAEQVCWIEEKNARGSRFLIVDEGPGRSGSTFLSVAEALVALGISAEQIRLLGTRQPQQGELCAKDAGPRWDRFQFASIDSRSSPRFTGHTYIGGGEWRKHFIAEEPLWPACWPQMERSKFLSADGKCLFKFEGIGRIGEEVRGRAELLAKTGFGVEIEDVTDGYSAYRVISGRPLASSDISRELLEHLARYCAMRDSEFKNEPARPDPVADMVRFNVRQEFGLECHLTDDDLSIGHRVIADGHMQPHEWLSKGPETILKVDAVSHGDDHFFPGPISIAWDLAGVIVEWNLASDSTEFFLHRFRQFSGRQLDNSIDSFCLAYSVFRMSLCKMAIPTANHFEQERLLRDHSRYRRAAEGFLQYGELAGSLSLRRISDGERAA
jgi:adenine/guanine phosphoribosyltransferase-like PRPP-binding protein